MRPKLRASPNRKRSSHQKILKKPIKLTGVQIAIREGEIKTLEISAAKGVMDEVTRAVELVEPTVTIYDIYGNVQKPAPRRAGQLIRSYERSVTVTNKDQTTSTELVTTHEWALTGAVEMQSSEGYIFSMPQLTFDSVAGSISSPADRPMQYMIPDGKGNLMDGTAMGYTAVLNREAAPGESPMKTLRFGAGKFAMTPAPGATDDGPSDAVSPATAQEQSGGSIGSMFGEDSSIAYGGELLIDSTASESGAPSVINMDGGVEIDGDFFADFRFDRSEHRRKQTARTWAIALKFSNRLDGQSLSGGCERLDFDFSTGNINLDGDSFVSQLEPDGSRRDIAADTIALVQKRFGSFTKHKSQRWIDQVCCRTKRLCEFSRFRFFVRVWR